MRLEDLLDKLRVNSYPSGRDDFHLMVSRPDVNSENELQTSSLGEVTNVKVDSDKKVIFLITE